MAAATLTGAQMREVATDVETTLNARPALYEVGDQEKPARVPGDEAFDGHEFLAASDIEGIGEMLRARHGMPTEVKVVYAWKRKGGKTQGKPVLGKADKVSGLAKYFGECDFVVWLAADHLRELAITRWQLEALAFHELNHIEVDDDLKPIVRAHDFAGFVAELEHYGTYQTDLERAAKGFAQAALGL